MKKRILTLQDISCLGQCSLTVALPIISAAGIETCVLPSAVLSTHTYGFKDFTFRDLTDDIPKIQDHWEKEGITFDALYTGYLGSIDQIEMAKNLKAVLNPGSPSLVDPAMADEGALYSNFDMDFVEAMKSLCYSSELLIPNVTEACFLTGTEYKPNYDKAFIKDLVQKMRDQGAKNIIMTSVTFNDQTTGVLIDEEGDLDYYEHKKYPKGTHGTGDIFASAFTGAYVQGISVRKSAEIAADFVVLCIENSLSDPDHWYGTHFEQKLGDYIQMVQEAMD